MLAEERVEHCAQASPSRDDASERVEALMTALAARSAEVAELRREVAAADIRHKVSHPLSFGV